MHDLLGRTKFARFHGHHTVADFVEMPSQLLENWCWLPESLKHMSQHYSYLSIEYKESWLRSNPGALEQPPERLPDTLIDGIVHSKAVNQALSTLRQIAFSLFDMKIHGPDSHEDVTKVRVGDVFNSTRRDVGLIEGPEDWVCHQTGVTDT